jgi:hypothetical protein
VVHQHGGGQLNGARKHQDKADSDRQKFNLHARLSLLCVLNLFIEKSPRRPLDIRRSTPDKIVPGREIC